MTDDEEAAAVAQEDAFRLARARTVALLAATLLAPRLQARSSAAGPLSAWDVAQVTDATHMALAVLHEAEDLIAFESGR